MNREDIIRMARESGLKDLCGLETTGWPSDARVDALIDFAALVAAAERETIEKRKLETVMHGWLCPACGRGNAPMTPTCPCKGWPKMEVTC